jgi:protein-disulfide isomerase
MKSQRHNSSASTLQNALPLICCLGFGILLALFMHSINQQHQRDISDLRKEIGTLNAGQVAVGKDIGEIRDLLRRQPTQQVAGAPAVPQNITLSLGDAPFKGNANAKLTLVEFTDYQSGFCARHIKETYPQLERDYISTGKVKYVFHNFPLESIHAQSFKAHEAAACAAEQGKFWEMHDRLFANQTALAPAQIVDQARSLGLNIAQFQKCFDADTHAAEIRKDIAEGEKAGVTGTPTFFLGVTSANSPTLKVTTTLVGAKPYAAFKQAIDDLLNAPSS